jgi:hypothetical protein
LSATLFAKKLGGFLARIPRRAQYIDEREGKSMEPENFLEPEIAVTAAVVAAICSPSLRRFLRRGLVYGTAGALMAGDAITSFTKNVGDGVKQAGSSMTQATQDGTQQTGKTNATAQAETTASTHKKHHAATHKTHREHTGEQEQGRETE